MKGGGGVRHHSPPPLLWWLYYFFYVSHIVSLSNFSLSPLSQNFFFNLFKFISYLYFAFLTCVKFRNYSFTLIMCQILIYSVHSYHAPNFNLFRAFFLAPKPWLIPCILNYHSPNFILFRAFFSYVTILKFHALLPRIKL